MLEALYNALAAIGYTHPIHPTQVNMPIGLVVGAFVLALAAWIFRNSSLSVSAYHCSIVAFLFLFPTAAAGIMDWQHYYDGVWLFPIKVKVGLAGFLFVLLVIMIALGRRHHGMTRSLLVVQMFAFLTVVALGYFGAEIVYGLRTPEGAARFEVGQRIFQANCSGCHPDGGNVMKPDHPIRGSEKLKSFDTFLTWVRNPESPMPPFPPETISEEQARELYNYTTQVLVQSHDPARGSHDNAGHDHSP